VTRGPSPGCSPKCKLGSLGGPVGGTSDPLEPSHCPLVPGNTLTMSDTLWSHRSSPSLAHLRHSSHAEVG
jgi:hypothetical protein